MDQQQLGTRPRPDDPYWRPGDADPATRPAARTRPGRAGPVVAVMLVGALAVVGLVVVLVTGVLGVLASSGGAPDPAPAPAAAPVEAGAPAGGPADAIRVGDAPADVEVVDGIVWTADRGSGTVTRLDPATGARATVTVGGEPTALVVDRGRAWVWNYSSALTPVGPGGEVEPLLRLPRDTSSIALSGDTLWYSQPDTGTLGRLDARSGAPLPPLVVGGRPDQIAVDRGQVSVLDGGAVRAFDATTGRPIGGPVTVPAGTSAVVAGEGQRYVIGEAGVARLGAPGTSPLPLRFGPLAGFAVGRDAVWALDTAGTLRRLSFDLRPLGQSTGAGSGGDVAVGPDGRVWTLDTAAGTVRAVSPG